MVNSRETANGFYSHIVKRNQSLWRAVTQVLMISFLLSILLCLSSVWPVGAWLGQAGLLHPHLTGTRHAALGAKSLQLSPSFMDTWECAKIRKLCSLSQHTVRVRRMPNCPESSPVLFLLTKSLDGLCLNMGYRH